MKGMSVTWCTCVLIFPKKETNAPFINENAFSQRKNSMRSAVKKNYAHRSELLCPNPVATCEENITKHKQIKKVRKELVYVAFSSL